MQARIITSLNHAVRAIGQDKERLAGFAFQVITPAVNLIHSVHQVSGPLIEILDVLLDVSVPELQDAAKLSPSDLCLDIGSFPHHLDLIIGRAGHGVRIYRADRQFEHLGPLHEGGAADADAGRAVLIHDHFYVNYLRQFLQQLISLIQQVVGLVSLGVHFHDIPVQSRDPFRVIVYLIHLNRDQAIVIIPELAQLVAHMTNGGSHYLAPLEHN